MAVKSTTDTTARSCGLGQGVEAGFASPRRGSFLAPPQLLTSNMFGTSNTARRAPDRRAVRGVIGIAVKARGSVLVDPSRLCPCRTPPRHHAALAGTLFHDSSGRGSKRSSKQKGDRGICARGLKGCDAAILMSLQACALVQYRPTSLSGPGSQAASTSARQFDLSLVQSRFDQRGCDAPYPPRPDRQYRCARDGRIDIGIASLTFCRTQQAERTFAARGADTSSECCTGQTEAFTIVARPDRGIRRC